MSTTEAKAYVATGTARGTVLHLVAVGTPNTLCGSHIGVNPRYVQPGHIGMLPADQADCARCLRRMEQGGLASPPKIRLRKADRWVACGITEFGPIGEHRHIVAEGGITTVCGATASHPNIWRANRSKPRCPQCVERYTTRRENR